MLEVSASTHRQPFGLLGTAAAAGAVAVAETAATEPAEVRVGMMLDIVLQVGAFLLVGMSEGDAPRLQLKPQQVGALCPTSCRSPVRSEALNSSRRSRSTELIELELTRCLGWRQRCAAVIGVSRLRFGAGNLGWGSKNRQIYANCTRPLRKFSSAPSSLKSHYSHNGGLLACSWSQVNFKSYSSPSYQHTC